MIYTSSPKKSAILLDAENILISAFYDKVLKGIKKQLIIKAVALALQGVAERMGSLAYQFAAVSLPPSGRLRDEAWSMIKDLADSGYRVTTVHVGPNASDGVIEKEGNALAKESDIDSIILATRDSREPYPSLLDTFASAGKKVCVAVYDYIPANFRGREIQYALLGGDVRNFVTRIKRWQEAELGEKSFRDTESERDLFLKKVIALALETLLWDSRIEGYIPKSFGSIIKQLSHNLFASFGVCATDKELEKVLRYLIGYTDLFENMETYIFNPGSSLLKQAKEEGGGGAC